MGIANFPKYGIMEKTNESPAASDLTPQSAKKRNRRRLEDYDLQARQAGNENLANSVKNIERYVVGEVSFGDVLDDYAVLYGNMVNSNMHWSWRENVPNQSAIGKSKRKQIKKGGTKRTYS